MADVFISYHVASAAGIVRQIAGELRKRGVTYWYSEGDMRPGFDFAQAVPSQIKDCKIFLLILDEGATKSSHVENELGLAFKRKREITILPFRAGECALSDWMGYYLTHIQIMNSHLMPPLDKRVEELAKRIEEILRASEARENPPQAETEQDKAESNSKIWKIFLSIMICLSIVLAVKGHYKVYPRYDIAPPETSGQEVQEVAKQTSIEEEAEGEAASGVDDKTEAIVEEMPVPYVHETVSAGGWHTAGLRSDGTAVAVGYNNVYNNDGQCDVSDWRNLVAVSAGSGFYGGHTVGLLSDGTAVAVGHNECGQCDVSDWRNLVAVSAGYDYTVGLLSDGTAVAAGNHDDKRCDVSDWQDLVAVSAGHRHTVGLRSDGTVVATGLNKEGQCNVADWSDIVAVSAGGYHTVGLRKDGRAVAVGFNNRKQCNVSNWKNLVAVSAGYNHTVGLRKDGTVVAVGNNKYGQCGVSQWRNVVAVSTGGAALFSTSHTVGLLSDGTAVATGWNDYGQCDVSDWRDIQLP